MSKNKKRTLFSVFILAVILIVWAMARVEPTKQNPDLVLTESHRTIIIGDGTQGTYGDLRIGVGNVRRDDYVVAKTGEKRTGRVIGLWLYYRPDPSLNKQITVYIDQRVQIGKYSFTVTNIEGGRGAVELRFDSNP